MKKQYLILFLLSLFSLFFSPFSLEAKKNKDQQQLTIDPSGNQPYFHQWLETNTKTKMSVLGQIYRPREDVVVMELFPYPEGEAEIKSVKIRTADGKVVEGKIRRLPFNYMPTARKNYQSQTPAASEVKA